MNKLLAADAPPAEVWSLAVERGRAKTRWMRAGGRGAGLFATPAGSGDCFRTRNQIVIVGGEAGGLDPAARLGRRLGPRDGPRQVLLIDRAVFPLWKPSLHEVAAGSLHSRQEGLDDLTLGRRNHFRFVLARSKGSTSTHAAFAWPKPMARRSTPACWRMSRMQRPFTDSSPRSSCHPPMTVAIC